MSSLIDPAAPNLDATVLAVEGVTGIFPAHGTLPQLPARVAAVIASTQEPSDVALVDHDDETIVTARIAASIDRPARVTASRVADRLAQEFPDGSVTIQVQVARIH